MNSARKRGIHILITTFVAVIMVVAMVVPVFAQQGPEIRVTDSEARADQPDVAIDSQCNVHIAYCNWLGEESSREIWYTMLDNNGNTLIDDTRITPIDGDNSVRPAIVVDSNDKVHIAWQDYRPASEYNEIYYTKLDPYLDNMDGDCADESLITLIQDKMVSDDNNDYSEPVRMAIDFDDNMHLVWREYGTALFYAKIDNNGNKIIDDVMLASGDFSGRPSVSVAVDSNNNAHIAWNDDENTDSYETYYKMLDGSDGSTLIDATLITPDDGEYSKGQSIVVDFQDKVHIIWKDQRGDGQAVYYTKLDSSLDDQNGDAADESAITLIQDRAISTDTSDYWVKRVASAIHCGHYINISWWEDYDGNDLGYLYYMVLDTDGNTEVTERTLTTDETVTTSTRWTVPYLDMDSNGKAHIT